MARVYFEPIGEEIECGEDETILDAAFNHGFSLVYGCREGQCSACKSYVLEGEVTLRRYSTFALSDSEEGSGYTLLCRAMPDTDLTIQLLHVQDDYRLEHPIRDGEGRVSVCEALTSDIYRLVLESEEVFDFTPGQYMDLHVPGTELRRSFSMACLPNPSPPTRLEFLIKAYPGGVFADLLGGGLQAGALLGFTGPYGSLRMSGSGRDVLFVAGGSGMAPVLSLLRELAAQRSGRRIRFFYGARRREDLFYSELVAELGAGLADFAYTEVLSDAAEGTWPGATGWVHEVAAGAVADLHEPEVYTCGPPPMVDALIETLVDGHGVQERDIHFDKFTTAAEPD